MATCSTWADSVNNSITTSTNPSNNNNNYDEFCHKQQAPLSPTVKLKSPSKASSVTNKQQKSATLITTNQYSSMSSVGLKSPNKSPSSPPIASDQFKNINNNGI